jgi:hypothetical protein
MVAASRPSALQRKTNQNSRPPATNDRPWDVSLLTPLPLALPALPADVDEKEPERRAGFAAGQEWVDKNGWTSVGGPAACAG